jgi:hypothetical protein
MNERDRYADLISYPGIRPELTRLSAAESPFTRLAAFRCLALSGDRAACDSMVTYSNWPFEDAPLVFAVAGYARGVSRFAESWLARLPELPLIEKHDSDNDPPDLPIEAARITLDAVYYSGVAESDSIISRVARLKRWPQLRDRARWMLGNPMTASPAHHPAGGAARSKTPAH